VPLSETGVLSVTAAEIHGVVVGSRPQVAETPSVASS
jgi:hypothetical protein